MRFFLKKACVFLLVISFGVEGSASIPDSAASLSLKEKIGQLFVIPAGEFFEQTQFDMVKKLVEENHVGGVIFKQGTAEGQCALMESLKKLSPIPLLYLQDAEWGIAMRLSDVPTFPKNLTLGAIRDLSLLYQLGQEMGRQCRAVCSQLNLAPVVDVNSNPLNPIIHMRSFGEDPLQVALRAEQLSLGMQSVGILTCVKHFPGHGDVIVDPHLALPCVSQTEEEWEKVDLLPFRRLIRSGVDAVLSAHLCAEGLEGQPFQLVTFSKEIITDLLRKKLNFNGLVISDALNMKALINHYTPEKIALGALSAGHDLLLYGDHISPCIEHILRIEVPCALLAIEEAVLNHEISEEEISEHVDRILAMKRRLEPVSSFDVHSLYLSSVFELKKRLFEEAVTVVRNEEPLPLPQERFALIEWENAPVFVSLLKESHRFDCLSIQDSELQQKLQSYPRVVLVFSGHSQFDLSSEKRALLQRLFDSNVPVIAVVLGTPYAIGMMPLFSTFVIAYENDPDAQRAAAKVVMGSLASKGRLPISIPPYFKLGDGLFLGSE